MHGENKFRAQANNSPEMLNSAQVQMLLTLVVSQAAKLLGCHIKDVLILNRPPKQLRAETLDDLLRGPNILCTTVGSDVSCVPLACAMPQSLPHSGARKGCLDIKQS